MNLVPAKLVKLKTDDGLVEMEPGVEIGKRYVIDLDSLKKEKMTNLEKKVVHEKYTVSVYEMFPALGVAIYAGYTFFDLLEVEAEAA